MRSEIDKTMFLLIIRVLLNCMSMVNSILFTVCHFSESTTAVDQSTADSDHKKAEETTERRMYYYT